MRKLNYYFMILCILAVAAGCDDTKEIDNWPADYTPGEVAFKGTLKAVDKTRLDITDGTTQMAYSWTATTDKIGIYEVAGSVIAYYNVPYSAASAASSSDFAITDNKTPAKWVGETLDHDFYAYYPYNANAAKSPEAFSVSVPQVQAQSAWSNFQHLPQHAFMYATPVSSKESTSAIDFQFNHLFSIVEVELNTEEGSTDVETVIFRFTDTDEVASFTGATLNLTNGTIDYTVATEGSNQVRVEFEEPLTITTSKESVYMVINPGHAGKEYKVFIEVLGDEVEVGEGTIAETGGLPAGKSLVVAAEVPAPKPEVLIDLSETATANAYIVNATKTKYKFKATVKGNATARNYAWTISEGEDDDKVDYPYTKNFAEGDFAISPAKAGVLWYARTQTSDINVNECPVNIESVELKDGYVHFETQGPFVNGNAIIAVWDNNDEILWSWNIWAVKDYEPETTAKTVGAFTVMDRNLGAAIGSDANATNGWDAAQAIGNYYQWGRKDPFPYAPDAGDDGGNRGGYGVPAYTPVSGLGVAGWDAQCIMYYDGLSKTDATNPNSAWLKTELGDTYTTDQAIEYTVKHPYKWVKNSAMTGGDNIYNNAPYLWTAPNYDAKSKDTKEDWRYLWGCPTWGGTPAKSMYDPCPPGWMVPGSGFNHELEKGSKAVSAKGYGYEISGLYIPRSGYRSQAWGKIEGITTGYNNVVKKAYLWNCNVATESSFSGYPRSYTIHYFDKAGEETVVTNPGSETEWAAQAFQVRCVKE